MEGDMEMTSQRKEHYLFQEGSKKLQKTMRWGENNLKIYLKEGAEDCTEFKLL